MAQQPTGNFSFNNADRAITQAIPGDPDLGPLKLLPGTWANLRNPDRPEDGPLNGRGWNLIALPFASQPPPTEFNYRLLMNQYNERLIITTKDDKVPNRGIEPNPPLPGQQTVETDQELVALDYEQGVVHMKTADFPNSQLKQKLGAAIHHEPGLFLFMKNQTKEGVDIARLGTVPHGNSLLILGSSKQPESGIPTIPAFSALPIGLQDNDINSPYLRPYKEFIDNPFELLFSPDKTHDLLRQGLAQINNVRQTTTFQFSSKIERAGIVNIPFINQQADATEMDVTFWLMELDEVDESGEPRLIMMYHQVVMLEFFARTDGVEGLIKWPHVSINTLERILKDPAPAPLTTKGITKDALR